jgi:cytochrome c
MIYRWSVVALIGLALAGCRNQSQQTAAILTGGGNPARGKDMISAIGCSSCHTIPGVPGADGMIGPSLDKIAARAYIGGVLKNTPTNMLRWLKDPPGVDPLTAMPNLHLTDDQVRDVAGYLYTLK